MYAGLSDKQGVCMIKQKTVRKVSSAVLALMASFALVATGCNPNAGDDGESNNPSNPSNPSDPSDPSNPSNPSDPSDPSNPGTEETGDFTATSQKGYKVSYDNETDTYTVTLEDANSELWQQQIIFIPKSESFEPGDNFHLTATVSVDKAVETIVSKVEWQNAEPYDGIDNKKNDVGTETPAEFDYYGTITESKNSLSIKFDFRGNLANTVVKIKGLKLEKVDEIPEMPIEYKNIVLYDVDNSINLLDSKAEYWGADGFSFSITEEGVKCTVNTGNYFGILFRDEYPVKATAKLVVKYTATEQFKLKPVGPDKDDPSLEKSSDSKTFEYPYQTNDILKKLGILADGTDSEILITYIAITDNEDAE